MKRVTVDELHPGDRVWMVTWSLHGDPDRMKVEGSVYRNGDWVMLRALDGSTYNLTTRSKDMAFEGMHLWLMDESAVAPSPIHPPSWRQTEAQEGAWIEESDSGGRKQAKDAAFALIPSDALWELAEHYGKGSRKYGLEVGEQDNWRKGYHWSLSYSAAFRHLTLAVGGEDVDPETGSKHVIAVAWHMLALAHWLNDEEMHKYDDRQDVMEKGDS